MFKTQNNKLNKKKTFSRVSYCSSHLNCTIYWLTTDNRAAAAAARTQMRHPWCPSLLCVYKTNICTTHRSALM